MQTKHLLLGTVQGGGEWGNVSNREQGGMSYVLFGQDREDKPE